MGAMKAAVGSRFGFIDPDGGGTGIVR